MNTAKIQNVQNALSKLEKRGAPIIGLTYTDAQGIQSKYDVQIGVRTVVERNQNADAVSKNLTRSAKGNLHLIGVDRNEYLNAREEGHSHGTAENLSIRAFRLDRMDEIRYGSTIVS